MERWLCEVELTQRWLLMIAIATALFAVSIVVLRMNIRTVVIFYAIGVSLVTLWMIVDAKYYSTQRKNVQPAQRCACQICKHDYVGKCLQDKCACCLVTKDEKVIGHSTSTLQ